MIIGFNEIEPMEKIQLEIIIFIFLLVLLQSNPKIEMAIVIAKSA